jgi:hypothetical protein
MTTAAEVACWPAVAGWVAALEPALGRVSVRALEPALARGPAQVREPGLAPERAPVTARALGRVLRPPEAPRTHLLRRRSRPARLLTTTQPVRPICRNFSSRHLPE